MNLRNQYWFVSLLLALTAAAFAARVAPADQPPQPTAVLPGDAQSLVKNFEDEATRVRENADRRIAKKRARLEKALKRLMDDRARQGKLDEAVAIRDQIRLLKAEASPAATSITVSGDPGTLDNYVKSLKQSFYFEVVGSTTGPVWGTDQYTNDSLLAAAAVQAGVLKAGETGIVKVTMLPGVAYYHGSTRNGVTSQDWQNAGDYVSYKVELGPAVATATTTNCPANAPAAPPTMTDYLHSVGQSFCFTLTGDAAGAVWGTDQYTNDSSLAAAAVHAGALKQGETGVVKVTMQPGIPSYRGSTRNGVSSQDWQNAGDYVTFTIQRASPVSKR